MALIRGNPGPHLVRVGKNFDPETGLARKESEYAGTQNGVQGLANFFVSRNNEHRQVNENGQGRVVLYEDEQAVTVLDKYEVLWEMEQKTIWQIPAVAAAAKVHDDAITEVGESTFRDFADGIAENKIFASPVGITAEVVANLRAGIDHYEVEYIVLRRTRVLPDSVVAAKVSVSSGSLIYTTEQLDLPNSVKFQLPSDAEIATFTNPNPTYFRWGWRRRPSTSIIQGSNNEQSSEFLLSLWTLLGGVYSAATTTADW